MAYNPNYQRLTYFLMPAAYMSVVGRSGNVYTADANGIITVSSVVGNNGGYDNDDLQKAGGVDYQPTYLGKLLSANMNTTTDQPFTMYMPQNAKYRITKITATNASISLSTCAGGVYTGASKTGTTLVAAGQTYSGLTTSLLAADMTLAAATAVLSSSVGPILSLTTAQGAAATADLYVYGDLYI